MNPQAMQALLARAITVVGIIIAVGFIGVLVMAVVGIRHATRLLKVQDLERTLRIFDTQGRVEYRQMCADAMIEKRRQRAAEAESIGPQGHDFQYLPPDLQEVVLGGMTV